MGAFAIYLARGGESGNREEDIFAYSIDCDYFLIMSWSLGDLIWGLISIILWSLAACVVLVIFLPMQKDKVS